MEAGKEKDVLWNDSTLNIEWEINENLSLSERDKNALGFLDLFPDFK